MNIRLRPELEKMVRQDVERGSYQSVDEFVEHAVSLLHEQETWLPGIAAKIEENYSAAQRGELIGADEFAPD
jgi:putative addiction module CopG family antidote